MADNAGTLERLALELAGLLSDAGARMSPDAVLDTFSKLGVTFPPDLLDDAAVSAAVTACRDAASSTSAAVDALVTAIEGSASPADVVLKGGDVARCGH